MRWTTHRRDDKYNLVECICEHGVGHPAYGSALWIAESLHPDDKESQAIELRALLVHGCCGCCGRDDFPGTPAGSLVKSHEIIRDLQGQVRFALDHAAIWRDVDSPPKERDTLVIMVTEELIPEIGVGPFDDLIEQDELWALWMPFCPPDEEAV